MKELTSTCEKNFLKSLISSGKRVDGRESEESRSVELVFGIDHGCCLATLGNTRVLAQVSCEMTIPRSSRPSEGQLQVSVELTAMAAPPSKDAGGRDANVQPSRQLERTLRESRCIDLESLCIVAGEKVWALRVAVYVLNHDGNIVECASVAAVAALLHFRRPDVTVTGVDVVVHPVEERDPVPVTLLHWPFSCTSAIFEEGERIVSDPTDLEERVSEGCVVISMNAHQEVCMLHLGGHTALSKEKLLLCTSRAYHRVKHLTHLVKEALQEDKLKRSKGVAVGFASRLHTNRILVTRQGPKELVPRGDDDGIPWNDEDPPTNEEDLAVKKPTIFKLSNGGVMLGEGGPSSWESLGGSDVMILEQTRKGPKTEADVVDISSEEEETVVMNSLE